MGIEFRENSIIFYFAPKLTTNKINYDMILEFILTNTIEDKIYSYIHKYITDLQHKNADKALQPTTDVGLQITSPAGPGTYTYK